jgi:hypothetical protein
MTQTTTNESAKKMKTFRPPAVLAPREKRKRNLLCTRKTHSDDEEGRHKPAGLCGGSVESLRGSSVAGLEESLNERNE